MTGNPTNVTVIPSRRRGGRLPGEEQLIDLVECLYSLKSPAAASSRLRREEDFSQPGAQATGVVLARRLRSGLVILGSGEAMR
jgi:hypothetical protein